MKKVKFLVTVTYYEKDPLSLKQLRDDLKMAADGNLVHKVEKATVVRVKEEK